MLKTTRESALVPARQTISVSLDQFDQERVAVILRQGEDEIVFRGIATFHRDDKLERILRICNDEKTPGNPEIILSEKSWQGQIIPDFQHGCRFCFVCPL